jgi:hypothetical protein
MVGVSHSGELGVFELGFAGLSLSTFGSPVAVVRPDANGIIVASVNQRPILMTSTQRGSIVNVHGDGVIRYTPNDGIVQ